MAQPVFGRNCTFAEAFPGVASARVTVTRGDLGRADKGPTIYTEANVPGSVYCHGSCQGDGSFDIQGVIAKAVREHKATHEDSLICYADESMGRGQSRSCLARVRVKVELTYRDEA